MKYYLEKCSELNQIAFLQWRKMFPSQTKTNPTEIEELIKFRHFYTFNSGRERLSLSGNDYMKIQPEYKY